jgi:DNA-binding PadR family transcriptional regulator
VTINRRWDAWQAENVTTVTTRPLLLGEWACLGILAEAPAHGYTVAQRLTPEGDIGRIWSVSRALTYRALGHLLDRRLVRELREEPGIAGGVRTPLALTARGRRMLDAWLEQPVEHLRDVRTEFLLKLQLCQNLNVDHRPLIKAQRRCFEPLAKSLRAADAKGDVGFDPVVMWRHEYSMATMHFLDRIAATATNAVRQGT